MSAPFDVRVVGNALNSSGFVTIYFNPTGLSLNTFGFLTPCDAIWTLNEPDIITVWAQCSTGMTASIEDCPND